MNTGGRTHLWDQGHENCKPDKRVENIVPCPVHDLSSKHMAILDIFGTRA